MPRSRRTWGTLKGEIYGLLRETEGSSYWSPGLLLQLWNDNMDMRAAELIKTFEGWMTDTFQTNLVAQQAEYTLPEGTEQVHKVWWVRDPSGNAHRIELTRDELVGGHTTSVGTVGGWDHLPTYRLVGELLVLNPPPANSITNGLEIEIPALPAHFEDDDSKLDQKWPLFAETLLKYDTAIAALGVEGSQGEIPRGVVDPLMQMHAIHNSRWQELIERRSQGRTFGVGQYGGD